MWEHVTALAPRITRRCGGRRAEQMERPLLAESAWRKLNSLRSAVSGLELAPPHAICYTEVRSRDPFLGYIPGQMSRGLKYDLDHLNDEFNCYISSFSPPLPPITALQSAFPSALIRSFGFQPACVSWPKGFGKTRQRFQSNEEMWVRVIQICEASERYTTPMVNKENKEKQNGGKKKRACRLGLIQPVCLEPRRWTACCYRSQLFFFFFNVLLSFWALFLRLINWPVVCVTEAP